MKQKIKQILYDMRHQPIIAWVSLLATAMSIFLIMVVVMMQRVQIVPYAPESCRDRLMLGAYMHVASQDQLNNSSAGLSFRLARLLYDDLEGVEAVSYMNQLVEATEVMGTTGESFIVNGRHVDAAFFRIFDHPLVSGRYFTPEEADAVIPVAVISATTARKTFGTTDCIGLQLAVDHKMYAVVGVVNDNTPLAITGSGDLFIATGPGDPAMKSYDDEEIFGPVSASLLVKEGVDFQSVRDQVKARYAIIDTELAPTGQHTVYHESPFDQETIAAGVGGSNVTPDKTSGRFMRTCIYLILLIVPAINLSNMLHSRMRRRVSEIGVRRAYGCTRSRIIADIIAENFLLTLAGGIIGVAIGVVFALTYSGLYENMVNYGSGATPAVSAVLNWGTVAIAVLLCFVLNIISAAIPAWKASRLNPVEAINTR